MIRNFEGEFSHRMDQQFPGFFRKIFLFLYEIKYWISQLGEIWFFIFMIIFRFFGFFIWSSSSQSDFSTTSVRLPLRKISPRPLSWFEWVAKFISLPLTFAYHTLFDIIMFVCKFFCIIFKKLHYFFLNLLLKYFLVYTTYFSSGNPPNAYLNNFKIEPFLNLSISKNDGKHILLYLLNFKLMHCWVIFV